MSDHGLVSIVVPCFNAGRLISQTLESAIGQSYGNWELLVVDDCSTDNTREVVSEHARQDSRIRLVKLETNTGGPATPRNVGVQQAQGNWVALLDADDIWHPRKLELQLAALRDHGAEFSSTWMLDFNDGDRLTFEHPEKVVSRALSFGILQLKNIVPTSSVIARRSLLLKYPFIQDACYKAVEDYHCWLSIHRHEKNSIKLMYPLLRYRKVTGQISASKLHMLKRVYMLHREFPGTHGFKALVFTLTHALGGFYYRVLREGL